MRIAWLGPASDTGGVPGMGLLLLEGVLDQGALVDLYTTTEPTELPASIRDHKNLRVIYRDVRWSWDRWYSRKPFRAFISGSLARARAHGRLCDLILEENARWPYDCVFQVSQTELFKLGRHRAQLPPIVIYPCVHAGGELRWHRKESAYARASERSWMHYLTRLILIYRTAVQKREVKKPAMILGMSRRFNELLSQDYGVDPARQAVLYHPIRTAVAESAAPQEGWREGRPVRLLYVARISVRKGVEQIIELSRRLDDLAGQIQIDVIGDRTQWSDYLAHLKELNPRTAKYLGGLDHGPMMAAYDSADILLLPSHYEPGGLVVGEALSRGVCAVVSDEVGSGEPVDEECCRKFPAGDMDAFEARTRQMIADVRKRPAELRDHARAQAVEQFAPARITARLLDLLQAAAKGASNPAPRVARPEPLPTEGP